MDTKRIVLALSGASGIQYALDVAEGLSCAPNIEIHLILSEAAITVAQHESININLVKKRAIKTYSPKDIGAAPASGSWQHHGMILCPCSMASLGAIANGLGSNLIHRAADVCLKEGRKLILVPRETPLNTIHLRNMLRASEAGATILPAAPGFYHNPTSITELTRHLAGKILDQLDIPHTLYKRWGE